MTHEDIILGFITINEDKFKAICLLSIRTIKKFGKEITVIEELTDSVYLYSKKLHSIRLIS
jgi:hypothetical protein